MSIDLHIHRTPHARPRSITTFLLLIQWMGMLYLPRVQTLQHRAIYCYTSFARALRTRDSVPGTCSVSLQELARLFPCYTFDKLEESCGAVLRLDCGSWATHVLKSISVCSRVISKHAPVDTQPGQTEKGMRFGFSTACFAA